MDIQKEQQLIYLTRRQSEVAKLKEASGQDMMELALMIGHRLKGHGETFGFPLISSVGTMMEAAAKVQDTDKVREMIQNLDNSVEGSIQKIKDS